MSDSSATQLLESLADGSLVVPGSKAARHSRREGLSVPGEHDQRTETERDRGRISYSPFLRRLAGVTQVTSPELSSTRFHSRASHTHKVATIAREIAENLVRRSDNSPAVQETIRKAGGLDISACESAGLAHDLGHPPFGHAGEQQLDEELRAIASRDGLGELAEGFEGNAQSFRIVTRLDVQRQNSVGLNLTNVTLAAIQKYPYRRQPGNSKFGAYESDFPDLKRCREALLGSDWELDSTQTLEASVMDIADDIAYAVHDLEDFIGAGAIDLRGPAADIELAVTGFNDPSSGSEFKKSDGADVFTIAGAELARKHPDEFDHQKYFEALNWAADLLSTDFPTLIGTPGPEELVMLREQLSQIIGLFFASIQADSTPRFKNAALIFLEPNAWHKLQCLKVMTRQYLVMSPRMGLIQRGQKQVISALFRGVADWLASGPDDSTIPPELKDHLEAMSLSIPTVPKGDLRATLQAGHYRAISDYICGMSDSEALLRAKWVSGSEIPGMGALGVQA